MISGRFIWVLLRRSRPWFECSEDRRRQSRTSLVSVSSSVAPPDRRRSVRMTTLRFLLKRFFAQRLLGLALVVTLGFTIGVLVAGPIYADAAREAILSSATSTAATTVRNVRFFTYGGPEFDEAA